MQVSVQRNAAAPTFHFTAKAANYKAVACFQNETPASLPIGTHVSAKYKGAFCEAKVRSVVKQVKCRVTFKFGYGSTTLSDEYIRCASPLAVGSSVTARHPDKQEYLEATINKIQVGWGA